MRKATLLFIQSEIAKLKTEYRQGRIDLKTLQIACKSLNNTAAFIAVAK